MLQVSHVIEDKVLVIMNELLILDEKLTQEFYIQGGQKVMCILFIDPLYYLSEGMKFIRTFLHSCNLMAVIFD